MTQNVALFGNGAVEDVVSYNGVIVEQQALWHPYEEGSPDTDPWEEYHEEIEAEGHKPREAKDLPLAMTKAGRHPLTVPKRSQPCWHLALRPPASRPGKAYTSDS